jgi:hypothetical protein
VTESSGIVVGCSSTFYRTERGAILISSASLGRRGDGAPVLITGEDGAAALGLAWRSMLEGEQAQQLSLLRSDHRRTKGAWAGWTKRPSGPTIAANFRR